MNDGRAESAQKQTINKNFKTNYSKYFVGNVIECYDSE